MASAATRKGTIKSNPNTCSPLPSSSVPIEMKTTEPSKDEEAALLGHMSQGACVTCDFSGKWWKFSPHAKWVKPSLHAATTASFS